MKFDFDRYGSAFLDAKLHRLRVMVTAQLDSLFERSGIEIPASCVSVVLFLGQSGPSSIAEIAEGTDYSHQLISQRLRRLSELEIVEKTKHKVDGRKLLVGLTKRGANLVPEIEAVLSRVAKELDAIFADTGCNLDLATQATLTRLMENSLSERINSSVVSEAGK